MFKSSMLLNKVRYDGIEPTLCGRRPLQGLSNLAMQWPQYDLVRRHGGHEYHQAVVQPAQSPSLRIDTLLAFQDAADKG